jgi:hypothetical protein
MARRQSRPQIAEAILMRAQLGGWLAHHARQEASDQADGYPDGFPPLVLVRGRQMLCLWPVYADGVLNWREERWESALAALPGCEAHRIGPRDLARLGPLLEGRDNVR